MAVSSYDELKAHINHELECVSYGMGENVAIECLNCGTVLLDFDRDFPSGQPPLDRELDRDSSPNSRQPKNGYHEDDHERRCDAHITEDNDDCTCQSPEELAEAIRERELADAVTEVPKPSDQTTEAMKRAIGLED